MFTSKKARVSRIRRRVSCHEYIMFFFINDFSFFLSITSPKQKNKFFFGYVNDIVCEFFSPFLMRTCCFARTVSVFSISTPCSAQCSKFPDKGISKSKSSFNSLKIFCRDGVVNPIRNRKTQSVSFGP